MGSSPPPTFPLDPYTTDLWSCYGLERLLTTATNLLRVRRSSDDAEQDIGYDVIGDLDTAALAAFVGPNNGFVVTRYDQTGAGNNDTQATKASQPLIVSSGSYLGFIRFDGSNDTTETVNAITAVSAFTRFTKLQRRSSGAAIVMFSNKNLATLGFNSMQGYTNGSPDYDSGLVGENGVTNLQLSNYDDVSSVLGVMCYVLDRAQLGAAKARVYKNGALLTLNNSALIGSAPTGNFSADTLCTASQMGVANFADIDVYNEASYLASKTTDLAAISAALA